MHLMPMFSAILLAACADNAPPDEAEDEVAVIRLVRVGQSDNERWRVATGTVRIRRETELAFLDSGKIQQISVHEGDRVAAGQRLAGLDRVAIDPAVTAAEAERARAVTELERQQRLKQQGWVAQARVDSAAAAARAADAELAARRFSQQFADIRAPSAGIILQRLAEPGQTIAAGTPVLVLGELASGHVLRAGLGAADVAGLAIGDIADIRFRDGAAPDMRGTVIEIAGRADPGTGTFQVEFSLPDGARLRSGMIGEARWRVPERAMAASRGSVVLVPASAVFAARAGDGFVWRYDAATKRISSQKVSIQSISDRGIVIASGLRPGDRIVAAGVDRLIEGQRVTPVVGE